MLGLLSVIGRFRPVFVSQICQFEVPLFLVKIESVC